MKGIGRKVSVLAMLTVFATAMLGAAYTLWYEDLKLNVNVATGELDGTITCTQPLDNDGPGQWPVGPLFNAYPQNNPYLNDGNPNNDNIKNVGSGTITQVNGDTVQLTILNGYPGYAFDCEYHIFNEGTVPLHIEDIQVVVQKCDINGNNCVTLGPPPSTWTTDCQPFSFCSWGDFGINPTPPRTLADWSPIYVALANSEGCQVHADNIFGQGGSFFAGVNQSASENSLYKISVNFRVQQWNESEWINCNIDKP